MQWQEVSPGVFYTDHSPVWFTKADLDLLQENARINEFGRARLCAHPTADASMHEMLICLARTTYIRPHRHFKPESALIIRGACDLVLFDEQGRVADVMALCDAASGGSFFVRLTEPIFHTYVLRTAFLLFLETTLGPFDRSLTEDAPWAPSANEPHTVYVDTLCKQIEAHQSARSPRFG
jgi:cupin fold WbuC family metalloprotein